MNVQRNRQRLVAIAFFVLCGSVALLGAWSPSAVVSAGEDVNGRGDYSAIENDPNLVAQNDGVTVRLSAASISVDENQSGKGNDHTLTVSVQVSVDPSTLTSPITVTYRTVNGTATGGQDYVAIDGVGDFIRFDTTDGTTRTKSFNVTILEDNTPEQDETFSVILQDPINASLAVPNVLEVKIENDDAFPTNTPTRGATPIYADIYESNNDFNSAYTLPVNDGSFCNSPNATLWPTGDVDYYQFWGKASARYTVKVDKLSVGLDTVLTVYGVSGQYIEQEDDSNGTRASQLDFAAPNTGYHFIKIENKDLSDPADKRYCVDIKEEIQLTSTPTPSATPLPTGTRVPGADVCEDNGSFEAACTIGTDVSATYNFVPAVGEGTDNDYYRVWVKQGWFYTCETLNLSSVNDTNMIIYDQNGTGLAGNDDKSPDSLGSLVEYYATYTGWLYILVGPYVQPRYGESNLYTYDLLCTAVAATPTPTPTNTRVFTGGGTGSGSGGGGGFTPPTSTPTPPLPPTLEPQPSVDIFATLTAVAPASPTPPLVQIVPLPTATPAVPVSAMSDVQVVLYYDNNMDFIPQLDEGIMDMAVYAYDGTTGQLLSFGYTNEAGMLRLSVSASTNVLRLSVPFLGFNQTVAAGTTEVRLRVVPQATP